METLVLGLGLGRAVGDEARRPGVHLVALSTVACLYGNFDEPGDFGTAFRPGQGY